MKVGRPRRRSSNVDEIDKDGNVLWHGVKLGEHWKTDMQVAINDSNRRRDASFTIRMGRAGTSMPFQQPIPADFSKYHKDLFLENLKLEGPTGQTWSTIINPSQQAVRFGRGWRQFSLENHLREGYQLLFTLTRRFHFLVQFFDHLGKRCTSYPPLPVAQPVARTQHQPDLRPGFKPGFKQVVDGGQASHRHGSEVPDLQPGFQQVVNGGQASGHRHGSEVPDLQPGFQQVMDGGQASVNRHGSEAQPSAAVPLMDTTPNSAIPQNSDLDKLILQQFRPEVPPEPSLPDEPMREPEEPNFDAGNGSEDMDTEEDDETETLAGDSNYVYLDSDNDDDDVLFCPPPATKPPLVKHDHERLTLKDLLLRRKNENNQAINPPPRVQYDNSSSSDDDEPPDMQQKLKRPVTRKKVTVKRRSPAPPHNVGAPSGSSPPMRSFQQQGRMRFSDVASKGERRDVSHEERRVGGGGPQRSDLLRSKGRRRSSSW